MRSHVAKAYKCRRCGVACEDSWQCEPCAAKYRAIGEKISAGTRAAWERRGTARTEPEIAWRNFATRAVRKAVDCGFLPDLRAGDYACVDCGGVATVYEHRDYTRVIDVEPVCQSCNMRRPQAPMPKVASFDLHDNNAQARGIKGADEGRNGSSS